MLYTEYRTAADKHLKTCIAILDAIDRLDQLDNSSLIINKYKQECIHNLYYLSGYILEAISTYSVYKHYSWTPNRSVKNKDTSFSNRTGFSFSSRHGYSYFVERHGFQTNQFEVLRLCFSNSRIPFIDSSITVSPQCQTLFRLWKAELRYHAANNHASVNENAVREFVSVTNQVYNSLLQIVG